MAATNMHIKHQPQRLRILLLAALVKSSVLGVGAGHDAAVEADDECAVSNGNADCAVSALQRKASQQVVSRDTAADEAMAAHKSAEDTSFINHYALPCWEYCDKKAGFCEDYCGDGNACCHYMEGSDPAECHGARFWPVLTFYTCVKTNILPDANKVLDGPAVAPGTPEELIYSSDAKLLSASEAPANTFYMYRVQGEQNYDPENQDMGSLAGVLWYLHNEIVWHPDLQRSGTYFATPKTRIERFKVTTKATQSLFELGMNFGPVNAFDLTRCTGPFDCDNFAKYGYTVGCEDWEGGSASFPHNQWVGANKYPGAVWYSLPGPCSSMALGKKTKACVMSEPGGACRSSTTPTGTGDCTYVYEKVGDLSINELEGITDAISFKLAGHYEYNKETDKGHGLSFWNDKNSTVANQFRIDTAMERFATKYPEHEDLPDPTCDFNKYDFYKGRKHI